MKTQRELNLKYWNDTYEMVEAYKKEHIGADVKPWQCVKYNGGTLCSHPDFRHHSTGGYEFAVAILYDEQEKQHRAIFPGDELFYLWEKVKSKDFCNGVLTFEDGSAVSLSISGCVTWSPHQPKSTFEINGFQLTEKEFDWLIYLLKDQPRRIDMATTILRKLDEK